MKLPEPIPLGRLHDGLARIKGDTQAEVCALSTMEWIEPGSLCFAENRRLLEELVTSPCTVVICRNEDYEASALARASGKTIWISDNPSRSFNDAIRVIVPDRRTASFPADSRALERRNRVSTSAVISDTASMGVGCVIYPNVFVGDHVRLGNNVTLFPGVVVHAHVRIGDDVVVGANTIIGGAANWYYREHGLFRDFALAGGVAIGSNVTIGANVCIDQGLVSDTVIEDGVRIGNFVQVGHGCRIGRNSLVNAQSGISGNVIVGEECVLGAQCGIDRSLKLAMRTRVGGKSGVTSSILKPGKHVFGIPAIPRDEHAALQAAVNQLPRVVGHEIFRIKSEFKARITTVVSEVGHLTSAEFTEGFKARLSQLRFDSLDVQELAVVLAREFQVELHDIITGDTTLEEVCWLVLEVVELPVPRTDESESFKERFLRSFAAVAGTIRTATGRLEEAGLDRLDVLVICRKVERMLGVTLDFESVAQVADAKGLYRVCFAAHARRRDLDQADRHRATA